MTKEAYCWEQTFMEDGMEDCSLSFDLLHKIQFPHPKLQGPPKPIDDYRLLAGLLFRRWNDRTYRSIQYSTSSLSTLHMESIDQRVFFYETFKVRSECVVQLHEEDCLEGALHDRDRVFLSTAGGRRVISEWFNSSAGILDHIAAGAALEVETGNMRWT